MNGKVPYFFARILGLDSLATQATATAALLKNFSGFKIPDGENNADVLPFALDKQTWDNMLAGGGTDVLELERIDATALPPAATACAKSTCTRNGPARRATAARSTSAAPTTAPATSPVRSPTA